MKKKCFKCSEEKNISEFYKHKEMADGHLGKCKDCTKSDSTKRRWSKIDEVRAYDRSRGRRGSAKKTMEYRKRFPLTYKATTRLNYAVSSGKIKKPDNCSLCGKKGRIEGHHEDYRKPLSVDWLCACCHRQLHHGIVPF